MKYILLLLCILSLSCKYNVTNPVGTLRDYTEGSGITYYVSSSATVAEIEEGLKKNKHSLGKYKIVVSATNDTSTNILNEIKKALINNSSFNNVEVDISKLEGITEIPEGVFKDVKNLGSISLSDKVEKIGKEAFSGCSSLTLVMLSSEKEMTIGKDAFAGCYNLANLVLPKSLKSVDNDAFKNCDKLKNVEYLGDKNKLSSGPFKNGSNPNNLYLPFATNGEFTGDFLGKSDWTKYKGKHIPN